MGVYVVAPCVLAKSTGWFSCFAGAPGHCRPWLLVLKSLDPMLQDLLSACKLASSLLNGSREYKHCTAAGRRREEHQAGFPAAHAEVQQKISAGISHLRLHVPEPVLLWHRAATQMRKRGTKPLIAEGTTLAPAQGTLSSSFGLFPTLNSQLV